jgi:hypothetical protein
MLGAIPPLLQYAFMALCSVKAQGQLYPFLPFTIQLMPWNRVLEKLIVTQLVKKFLAFYGTPKFISVFTRAQHWSKSWGIWIHPKSEALRKISLTSWVLRWGVVSSPSNPQAEGSPLIGCPPLLIQYIRSFPPYLYAISSIPKLRTCHAVVTGTHRRTWTKR